MDWIVLNEKSGYIVLTSSKSNNKGILPVGSYLTVCNSEEDPFYVLRVEESEQDAIFNPTPLLADLNLNLQESDRECKNIIRAKKVLDLNPPNNNFLSFIKPQSKARLSSQSEIAQATNSNSNDGPFIFPASVQSSRSQKLRDLNGDFIKVRLPMDIYWHQMQITGKTGSGKTVATKYLSEYFIENQINEKGSKKYGCVLAINVKDTDFLLMDKPSNIENDMINHEWDQIEYKPRGLTNYQILFSAHENIHSLENQGVTRSLCKPITLDAQKIDPKSLLGIVENLTSLAQQSLPDIFRYWQRQNPSDTYGDFLNFFAESREQDNILGLDVNEREVSYTINTNTLVAMEQRLREAGRFFDNELGEAVSAEDILQEGKYTVIDVSNSIDFGSIVLSFLLNKILELKQQGQNNVPILIIIDEVHQFYKSSATKSALAVLDTICRVGRSRKIGVIFSSQNVSDIPDGLSSVINTSFKFKTDEVSRRENGVDSEDIMSMQPGFSIAKIHGLPHLKVVKIPVSRAGSVI